MRVTLEYECPVYVVVDTDIEQVVEVVVSDEELTVGIAGTPAVCDNWEWPVGEDGQIHPINVGPPPDGVAEKAKQVAEAAEWPAWQFGW